MLLKKIKSITPIIVLVLFSVFLCGCTESSKVDRNLSQEAENFNITRRFAVINTRTDKVEFEFIGNFSRESTSGGVALVVELEDGSYRRHIVGLNDDTMYVIEDLGKTNVNKYKYEIHYLPESIIPIEIVNGEGINEKGE